MSNNILNEESKNSQDSNYDCYAYSSEEGKSSDYSTSGKQEKDSKRNVKDKAKLENDQDEINPSVQPEFDDNKYYMDKSDSMMK